MSEQRITPRSSAFPRAPRDPAPSPDPAATAAAAESARAASVELAIHGDPSVAAGRSGAAKPESTDKRLRVDWVRPTDLAARLGAGGIAHGAEWNMRAHQWLRAQPRRVGRATVDLARRLPPLSRFGRDGAARRAPQRSALAR